MIVVPVYRRFSDLDPLGHVNNVAYHDYLQEARVGLIGDLSGVVGPDFAHIVVRQEIRHVRPLGHGRAPVEVEMWVASIARASYSLAYRIRDDEGEVAAEASSDLAVVAPDGGRPIRIPDHIRHRLEEHLEIA